MEEPIVSVGILRTPVLRFAFLSPYRCGDGIVAGTQEACFSNGKIRWNDHFYDALRFTPAGSASPSSDMFTLEGVAIGIDFHWERRLTQQFCGELHVIVEEGQLRAVNVLPVELYLSSVISSEMSASASLEFLKAHAVISRSWLLTNLRANHRLFDVCADDHCQRYQGMTHALNPTVVEAIRQTRGQVLTYGGEICDTRYSKCCGGRTETFGTCWDGDERPYLQSVACPWCNTHDAHILAQVLNDYDLETADFHHWTVHLTQESLCQLLVRKLHVDLGRILRMEPLSRGASGRISRLRLVGERGSMVVEKELAIRRALSDSHLYSSAFTVEPHFGDGHTQPPTAFTLHGRGWGHGVGLCQIGAAVMGQQGYSYSDILRHYYPGAEIKRRPTPTDPPPAPPCEGGEYMES